MKIFRLIMTICSLALLSVVLVPRLSAGNDVWNKKTTLTFSQPFEIPGGQVLPAGTYVFKLLDSPYDRDIVQIFNEDQTHVYATILAIPNYRLRAPQDTVMRFEERESGSPQAIKAWFHPGSKAGQEFVYPKARAVELAKIANEPVPSIPMEVTPNITTVPAEESVAALEKVPIQAEEPTGEELPVSRAFAPEPVQTASLPKTASSMPLIGLIGLFSLAGALGIFIVTKLSS